MPEKQMIGGCCICLDERGWKENPLVYCDGPDCNVAVHQDCYGILKVPTGPWYCQKCESNQDPKELICALCPKLAGALKRTERMLWAHVVCALYIPEAKFGNVNAMEPIILSDLPASRYNRTCYICEENNSLMSQYGACMNCARPNCTVAFHVTCAQGRGLLSADKVNSVSQYCGYCGQHAKKPTVPKGSGIRSASTNSLMALETNSVAGKSLIEFSTEENPSQQVEARQVDTVLTVDVNESSDSTAKSNTSKSARSKSAKSSSTRQSGPKPKRSRKAPAKKNAGQRAMLVSPLRTPMRSPLHSPLRSPTMRSPSLHSPVFRTSINLAQNENSDSTSMQTLLEQHFEMAKRMLESHAPLDIAQLLACISKIQQENKQLEEELKELTARRDHLVSINARLSLPCSASGQQQVNSTYNNNLNSCSNVVSQPNHIVNQAGNHVMLNSQHSAGDNHDLVSRESSSNSQKQRRTPDSVIKVNKQGSTPTSRPSSAHPPRQDQSHFMWPPAPVSGVVSVPSSSAGGDNRLQSVGALLPPITALSQRLPASVQLSSAAVQLSSAAAYQSPYPAHYYPQYGMLGVPGAMALSAVDMASLSQSVVPAGYSLQGLHNTQSYYHAHEQENSISHGKATNI